MFLARTGFSKDEMKTYIEQSFRYPLDETLEHIRAHNRPWVTCPQSVPQAITAFLISGDFEGAIRNAVSLGGDADTVAAIAVGDRRGFLRGRAGAHSQAGIGTAR